MSTLKVLLDTLPLPLQSILYGGGRALLEEFILLEPGIRQRGATAEETWHNRGVEVKVSTSPPECGGSLPHSASDQEATDRNITGQE